MLKKQNAKNMRGTPRLVINYKPLNKVLEWIRHAIPNKNDLIHRQCDAVVFSKTLTCLIENQFVNAEDVKVDKVFNLD